MLSSGLRALSSRLVCLGAAQRFPPALRRAHAAELLCLRRGYVQQAAPQPGQPRSRKQDYKLRYLVLITAITSGLFYFAVRNPEFQSQRANVVSPEEYERIKAKPVKKAFDPEKVFVVFVLGGPGSGKGTQSEKIVREYDFVHLSAGDLLRAEQQREGSQYKDLIASYIKRGQIVPQEITIALLKEAIERSIAEGHYHFIIDGFPRKMDQALTFEEKVVPCKFVLYFPCPEPVMLKRILKRAKTSGRADDNEESLKARFKVFEHESKPVVDYYAFANKVNAVPCDQSIKKVHKDVEAILEQHGIQKKK